ncbi:polysaccharide deacetylase family protein [Bacillus sp. SL00103]
MADGHEIGNHSYNHPGYAHTDKRRTSIRADYQKRIVKLKNPFEKTEVVRPSSGSFKEETVKLAAEEGMETIMWTVDTIDWQNRHQTYYKTK